MMLPFMVHFAACPHSGNANSRTTRNVDLPTDITAVELELEDYQPAPTPLRSATGLTQ